MRLFKRENGIWYVEFERNVRRSLRTRSRDEAYRLFKRLQREYLRGNLKDFVKEGKPEIKLSKFAQEYLDWCEKALAPATHEKAVFVLKSFINFTGNKYLSSVGRRDLDSYVSYLLDKGYAKTTVNIHIRTLKAIFSKAVDWEYLEENPFAGYKALKTQSKPPAFLLPEDIEKVEKVIDDPDWLFIFRLFVYTGMRKGEVSRLKWEDVDLERELIVVKKSKNYRSRVIPIHPKLLPMLKERYGKGIKVCPRSYFRLSRGMKRILVKAGYPHLRLHDLRHTFASLLVMRGVDLKTVQELLGHTDYRTTEIYAHLSPHHLKEAVRKL